MKLRLAFILLVVAILSHLYLTNHYYELSFGLAEDGSVCNINKVFSCDTVSASQFSTFLGIPMAAWGAATNAVILVLLVGWIIRWTDDLARLASYAYYLSAFSALVSVVMATLSSVVLGTFCLFCIAAYVCSFAVFELLRRSREADPRTLKDHLVALKGPARSYLLLLVAIPVGAVVLNKGILSNYGAKNLGEFVNSSISDWQANPKVEVTTPPSLIKGATDEAAKVTIVEFADFRCGHCKSAAAPLSAFAASRSDVQLRFLNFPLDSSCNPNVEFGDGISCLLARAVTCAEKANQKGWDMHDQVFSHQGDFGRLSAEDTKAKVLSWAKDFGADETVFAACLEDEATRKLVSDQAAAGKAAGVRGTPTVLVNGRKLPRGQSLHVLEKAYELAKKNH
jgi:protein-disulfide isomerase/uncharacterized membrane protein